MARRIRPRGCPRGPPPGPVELDEKTLETGDVSSLGYLAAVNVVIWVGLFLYLWRLDRRIEQLGRRR